MDKIRGILWPFLVWSTIYCVVIDIHFSSIWELRKLYTGGSNLWFLFFTFIYYLAAKPLDRINPLLVSALALSLSFSSPDGENIRSKFYI